MLSVVPAILTLIDFNGRVLYQNAESLGYMGDLLTLTQHDGVLGEGLLRPLFAYDPGSLEHLLEEVLAGNEWQGVVQVRLGGVGVRAPGAAAGKAASVVRAQAWQGVVQVCAGCFCAPGAASGHVAIRWQRVGAGEGSSPYDRVVLSVTRAPVHAPQVPNSMRRFLAAAQRAALLQQQRHHEQQQQQQLLRQHASAAQPPTPAPPPQHAQQHHVLTAHLQQQASRSDPTPTLAGAHAVATVRAGPYTHPPTPGHGPWAPAHDHTTMQNHHPGPTLPPGLVPPPPPQQQQQPFATPQTGHPGVAALAAHGGSAQPIVQAPAAPGAAWSAASAPLPLLQPPHEPQVRRRGRLRDSTQSTLVFQAGQRCFLAALAASACDGPPCLLCAHGRGAPVWTPV